LELETYTDVKEKRKQNKEESIYTNRIQQARRKPRWANPFLSINFLPATNSHVENSLVAFMISVRVRFENKSIRMDKT